MVTNVVQVTNVALEATIDQMSRLFGFLGKIDDIRLYPSIRDDAEPVQSRICYVKFNDSSCVGDARHLTNTVVFGRGLIVIPVPSSEIPDEQQALEIMASGSIIGQIDQPLPAHVVSRVEGTPPNQYFVTIDPNLDVADLPKYPNLPSSYDIKKVEEIRRTLLVYGFDDEVTEEDLKDFFTAAGKVNWVKFCSLEDDPSGCALVEFTEQPAIIKGLKMDGAKLNGKCVDITHSLQAIIKPKAITHEAALREIEEDFSQVKIADDMNKQQQQAKDKKRTTRKRSRSRSLGSRSHRRLRSRSRRRSRSRGRRSNSRSSSRKRSRSSSRRHSRSPRKKRSRSRSRKRSRDVSPRSLGSRSHRRLRSRSRRRSRSRGRRSNSRSSSRKRSRSSSRRHSRSPRKKRSRSRSRKRSRDVSIPEAKTKSPKSSKRDPKVSKEDRELQERSGSRSRRRRTRRSHSPY